MLIHRRAPPCLYTGPYTSPYTSPHAGASTDSPPPFPHGHTSRSHMTPLRPPSRTSLPPLVGVGASAGGIAALRAFLGSLPGEAPITILVAVHLAPDRESNLAEVLQTASEWPVTEVRSRAEIEAGHVYVVSPGHDLTIENEEIQARPLPASDRQSPRVVDRLFRSLAASGLPAAGIVLSGGGSDGAAGLKAIKEAGGLVLAEDPSRAEHDGMPRSALATGVVDATLPAAKLGPALLDMLRHGSGVPEEPSGMSDGDAERLEDILAVVRRATGHDFSTYKRSTVLRRIRRRLQVHRLQSLNAYLDHLREEAGEVDALFRDLLIGVTQFFRDPEAFDALKRHVLPALFEGKDRSDTVRVWVVGCSTGEEVYSLAMLLREEAGEVRAAPDVQIFASDLSEEALQQAREGRYPASIASEVSEARLRRFFQSEGDTYRVKRSVREQVIFARHGVLRDPPFSRLDLVSCRNLLIFLQRAAQRQVLETLHYSLRSGGYLFLGTSETTGRSDLFRSVHGEHSLYQARERARTLPQLPMMRAGVSNLPEWEESTPETPMRETPMRETPMRADRTEEDLHRESLEQAAPPSLLVDEYREVLHLSERAGRYLQHPGGPLSSDVTELARPELRPELREALHRLFESGEATVARPVPVQIEGQMRTVYLTVRPAQPDTQTETTDRETTEREPHEREPQTEPRTERRALVLFNEGEPHPDAPDPDATDPGATDPGAKDVDATDPDAGGDRRAGARSRTAEQLRRQLRETRRRLRQTREQFKASREEMRAQNEELRSMNEEYKSATEELETSKEELQSVNEELETVNEELEHKLDEVSEAHSDLKNLVEATDIATIFLGEGLRIRRFTPSVSDLFNIRETDIGRPITELSGDLDYTAFEADAEQVLEDLVPITREVQSDRETWYLMHVRPYRTVDNVIDGVVFTFTDITAQKTTEARLRQARDYAESIVDTVREGLVVVDDDLRVVSANDSFYDTFDGQPDDAPGQLLYELAGGQWDLPQLRDRLEKVLPNGNGFEGLEVSVDLEDPHSGEAETRTFLLNARRLDHVQKILLAIKDVTERQEAIKKLRRLNDTLEERVRERTETIRKLASDLTMAEQKERQRISQVLHDDLQQRLCAIQARLDLLRQDLGGEGQAERVGDIDKILTWTGQAITATRNLAVGLAPPVLEGESLIDALGWLQSQMQEMHGFTVHIEENLGEGRRLTVGEEMRVLLFRVVRELLFNAVKYAETGEATVRIEHPPEPEDPPETEDRPETEDPPETRAPLTIHVIDDGAGFDPDEALEDSLEDSGPRAGGMGLQRSRERLELVGGRLHVDTAPGEGTHMTIYMPGPSLE